MPSSCRRSDLTRSEQRTVMARAGVTWRQYLAWEHRHAIRGEAMKARDAAIDRAVDSVIAERVPETNVQLAAPDGAEGTHAR